MALLSCDDLCAGLRSEGAQSLAFSYRQFPEKFLLNKAS
jgi:hypothetical protein